MIYDLIIIGGGPAGSAAAVYAARKQLHTAVITKDWLGQSNVSEKIENWIGTVAISGLDLSKALEKHAKAYAGKNVDFFDSETCVSVSRDNHSEAGNIFIVRTDKGSYGTKTILVSSGSRRKKLDIEGAQKFEHKGVTYCASCDGPMYSGMDVAVVGGGNAAFESAAQLLAYCKSVTMFIRGTEFRADPATVAKVLSHPNIKAVKLAVPKEVKGEKFASSLIYTDLTSNNDIEIKVSAIFVEIGAIPNTDFIKNIANLDAHNHIITDPRNQRTSETGIWSAGDCTDGLYHQNNIAAGDAVKAVEDIYSFLRAR